MKPVSMLVTVGILLSVLLAACSAGSAVGSGSIKIENAWARTGLKDGTGAVYFVVNNPAAQDDKMVSVKSDVSQVAEMHITLMEGSTMKMVMQPNIPIGAGSKVELKPGGTHIMLISLQKDLKPGDTVNLTLNFERGGAVQVAVPVREP